MQQPLQLPGAAGQLGDLRHDALLVLDLFEAVVLGPVHVGLLGPFATADDEVEPHKELQVRAAEPLPHGQPKVLIGVLTSRRQPHE